MEPVIIKTSTAKLIRNIFFGLVFIAVGCFIWGHESDRYSKEFIYIISVLCIVFSLTGIVVFTKKLLSNDKVALIIDERGITEKSTGVSLGLVPWEDITEIGISRLQAGLFNKAYFISVYVKNPDEYIGKGKNAMVRQALNWNMKNYGSPINIMPQPLGMKHDELERIIREAFEQYKTNP